DQAGGRGMACSYQLPRGRTLPRSWRRVLASGSSAAAGPARSRVKAACEAKTPGQVPGFLLFAVEVRCRSVPGDDGPAVEPIVHADLHLDEAHAQVEEAAVGGGDGLVAEVHVVGFGLCRPVRGEGEFGAVADQPSGAADAG